tara:strand:+ start:164 stop:859 length:696 start_codon:yes stop_codon:yes gene_type:complete
MRIETKHPDATGPDFDSPTQGATENNHSNEVYLSELGRATNKKNFSYMDLGCAGGQSVVELHENGHVTCGVEGSDLGKMISVSKSRSTPHPRFIGDTEIHNKDIHDNWTTYKDVCLFKGDITKPFEIKDGNNELQKFDIITAWDVLEHPNPEDIPQVIENVKKHLNDDGQFICLINLVSCEHHRCIRPREWWIQRFKEQGLEDIGFDFNASPRHTHCPLDTNDLGFIFKQK